MVIFDIMQVKKEYVLLLHHLLVLCTKNYMAVCLFVRLAHNQCPELTLKISKFINCIISCNTENTIITMQVMLS